MDALKVTLPSECTDVTIPTETELIFKVLKKGDGSGLSYIGVFQYNNSPTGEFPFVEIIRGDGQLYLDKAMTRPVAIVDTAPTNRNNLFYLKANSDVVYLKIGNAHNVQGLYTTQSAENTRSFFAPLSVNSPVMDAYLTDFFNAVRLENLTLANLGAEKPNPQYYHGDLSDLSHIKPLNLIHFEGQKYITGNIKDLYAIANRSMISMFVSSTNIEGVVSNDADSGYALMSAVFAQKTPKLAFHTSAFKYRTYSAGGNTSWGVTNLKGDLSDIPKVYSLYFRIDESIDDLIYSRSRALEFVNLREFSIMPKMNLQMLESLIADLANATKVTYITGAIIALFARDEDLSSVSATTKGYITTLRNKGIIFTTNIIV